TLIVLGTGLLKGNVGVIVGRLYGQDDARRDAAFSIFYMGINLGAFIAPLICGYLGQRISWHLGFAAAGFGMLIGLAQYVAGAKYLGDAGLYPATPQTPASPARVRSRATLWGTAAVALAGALAAAACRGLLPISATEVSDAAGSFLLLLMIGFFGWLYFGGGWTAGERTPLDVIGALFLASIVFWSEFEQAGSTLNLFGDRATRTSVLGWTFPSSYYQSLQPLFIITFAPVFAWLWTRMGRYEPSSPAKFAV